MFILGTRRTCLSFLPLSLGLGFLYQTLPHRAPLMVPAGPLLHPRVSGHWVKCPEARNRSRLPGEGPRHVAWCWVSVTSPPLQSRPDLTRPLVRELIQRRGVPQREARGSLQVPREFPWRARGQGPGAIAEVCSRARALGFCFLIT